jgi:lysylphosphatidylglycerol synthetase-like protein (DUF2156 family)
VFYRRCGRIVFSLGSPVTALAMLPDAAAEFESQMTAQGMRCTYFGCENPHAEQLAAGRCRILIGSQPILTVRDWRQIKAQSSGLRAQIKRGRRRIAIVTLDAALIRSDATLRMQLDDCLCAWLQTRRAPQMGFAADGRMAAHLEYFHRVSAAVDAARQIQALICVSQIRSGQRFIAEHIARRPTAPNGVVEALVDHLMLEGHLPPDAHVSLGLTALSERYLSYVPRNPLSFQIARYVARRWGNWFYNFAGLEQFRHRLCPTRWEPVFIVSDRRIAAPELAFGLVRLFFHSGTYVRRPESWQ